MKIRSGVADDVSHLARVALNSIAGSGYSIQQKEMWSRTFTDGYLAQVVDEDVFVMARYQITGSATRTGI